MFSYNFQLSNKSYLITNNLRQLCEILPNNVYFLVLFMLQFVIYFQTAHLAVDNAFLRDFISDIHYQSSPVCTMYKLPGIANGVSAFGIATDVGPTLCFYNFSSKQTSRLTQNVFVNIGVYAGGVLITCGIPWRSLEILGGRMGWARILNGF